jgi:hypothetical protein
VPRECLLRSAERAFDLRPFGHRGMEPRARLREVDKEYSRIFAICSPVVFRKSNLPSSDGAMLVRMALWQAQGGGHKGYVTL